MIASLSTPNSKHLPPHTHHWDSLEQVHVKLPDKRIPSNAEDIKHLKRTKATHRVPFPIRDPRLQIRRDTSESGVRGIQIAYKRTRLSLRLRRRSGSRDRAPRRSAIVRGDSPIVRALFLLCDMGVGGPHTAAGTLSRHGGRSGMTSPAMPIPMRTPGESIHRAVRGFMVRVRASGRELDHDDTREGLRPTLPTRLGDGRELRTNLNARCDDVLRFPTTVTVGGAYGVCVFDRVVLGWVEGFALHAEPCHGGGDARWVSVYKRVGAGGGLAGDR